MFLHRSYLDKGLVYFPLWPLRVDCLEWVSVHLFVLLVVGHSDLRRGNLIHLLLKAIDINLIIWWQITVKYESLTLISTLIVMSKVQNTNLYLFVSLVHGHEFSLLLLRLLLLSQLEEYFLQRRHWDTIAVNAKGGGGRTLGDLVLNRGKEIGETVENIDRLYRM